MIGIRRDEDGAVTGVETNRGFIGCNKLALAAAGHTSILGNMADLELPIETHVLQAFVSEGLKPVIDNVITYGAGHFYISQSDKGGLVFGADIDYYSSYSSAAILRPSSIRWRRGWRLSLACRACACCAPGAA